MLYVGIKYSMHDELCDVIGYCPRRCGMGNVIVNYMIISRNLWKEKICGSKKFCFTYITKYMMVHWSYILRHT